ncbi:MAG: serine protease, partial [Pirellulaceae bacterium]|nr:serine protease [Pirellulaceae bacterium]
MKACVFAATLVLVGLTSSMSSLAQSVCLPSPRLLTTMPMGGQVGGQVEIKITGDNIDDADTLMFSHPAITAKPKLDAAGKLVANTFVVSIGEKCPLGVHEARLLTRLGVSSSRVFNVGAMPEVTQSAPNTSLKTALDLQVNSTCNAVMTRQAIDYYRFHA